MVETFSMSTAVQSAEAAVPRSCVPPKPPARKKKSARPDEDGFPILETTGGLCWGGGGEVGERFPPFTEVPASVW